MLDDTFDDAEIETEMGDLDDIEEEIEINVKETNRFMKINFYSSFSQTNGKRRFWLQRSEFSPLSLSPHY